MILVILQWNILRRNAPHVTTDHTLFVVPKIISTPSNSVLQEMSLSLVLYYSSIFIVLKKNERRHKSGANEADRHMNTNISSGSDLAFSVSCVSMPCTYPDEKCWSYTSFANGSLSGGVFGSSTTFSNDRVYLGSRASWWAYTHQRIKSLNFIHTKSNLG